MIGRLEETRRLENAYASNESEFVAVYGRRRVGKTYLVRETFDGRFVFRHAGLAEAGRAKQLARFAQSLSEASGDKVHKLADWDAAFDALKTVIDKSLQLRKVIFIDEMPWMDTPRSGFVTALESFWNGWASARKDVLLIVCGSAASWIVRNLLRNKGGLHNRVTCRIHLKPFTLAECAALAHERGLGLSKDELADGYMILGGIPYYWKYLERGKSLAQNIDALFFADSAPLRYEFNELYSSLFGRSDVYRTIVQALYRGRKCGMTRLELCAALKVGSTGMLTKSLEVLEQCGFIETYTLPGTRKRGAVIRLMDAFTIFHFKFLEGAGRLDEHTWSTTCNSPAVNTWRGLAFERVCLAHLPQIRAALGISGIHIKAYTWYHKPDDICSDGAQVDLVIERADNVINLCEMKYSRGAFRIDKSYAAELRNKISVYEATEHTRKALHLTMIASNGLAPNEYSGLIQSTLTLDALFGQ